MDARRAFSSVDLRDCISIIVGPKGSSRREQGPLGIPFAAFSIAHISYRLVTNLSRQFSIFARSIPKRGARGE